MRKKIPYGISNFQDLPEQNYIYIDKTAYIRALEELDEKYVFFLRPRRFGKSLFVSLLDNYYDINTKDRFPELFQGLYIGENPTSLANSYYILSLNFSGIDTTDRKRLQRDFISNLLETLHGFCEKYNIKADYTQSGTAAQIMNSFFKRIMYRIDRKIYLIIDEYDHFANELLSFQIEVFKETISRTGFVRNWFEIVKNATASGVIDRIFATGVSPVTLDSLTSGFNIASNLTRDAYLNEMLGFTEEEILLLINELPADSIPADKLLSDLKSYYNGYLFSEMAHKKLYNSDMVLYYIKNYLRTGGAPIELVDSNVSSDYAGLQTIFTLQNKERNYRILRSILRGELQLATITREFSLAKEFTEEDFLSLLFYLGFLTIDSAEANMVALRVPNYAIKELYFDFFSYMLKEDADFELSVLDVKKSIMEISRRGNIKELVSLTEALLEKLAFRDMIKFDEKYIKILLLSYLTLSKVYTVKSEYEVAGGYIDIAFFKKSAVTEDIYEGLIELKYIKKADYEKHGEKIIEEKTAEGQAQLCKYIQSEELCKRPKMLKWLLVFVGSKCLNVIQVD